MKSNEIRASDLSEIVDLLRPVRSRNAANETIETFVSAGRVYAEIEEGGGREFYAAEKLQTQKKIRAKIYYRDDIASDWRFSWSGKVYKIHDIAQIKPRKGLVLSGAENITP